MNSCNFSADLLCVLSNKDTCMAEAQITPPTGGQAEKRQEEEDDDKPSLHAMGFCR